VGRIIVLVVLADLGIGLVTPLWALQARHLGMSPVLVGLMVTLLGLGRLVTSLAGGLASDRFGRRRVLLTGLAGLAIAATGGALTPFATVLFPLRVVEGIGWELMAVSATTAMTDLVRGQQRQGALMTRYSAARRGTQAAAPVLGGLIAVTVGLRAAFGVYAALAVLAALAAWRLLPTLPATTAQSDPETASSPSRSRRRAVNLLGDPGFGALGILALLLMGADLAFQQFLVPTLGTQDGLSALQIGIVLAAYGILIGVVNVTAGGRLIDKLGAGIPLAAGSIVAALGYALVPALHGFTGLLVAMSVAGFGRAFTSASPTLLLLRRFPEQQGRVQGVYRTVSGIGRLVLPVGLGAAGAALAPAIWGLAIALVLAAGATIGLTARPPRTPRK
jgi:predicted MFS family arabinose efflux permease